MAEDEKFPNTVEHKPYVPVLDDVIWAINHGGYDTDLDIIIDAIDSRRKRTAIRALDKLHVGDLVIVKNIGTGGKYLNGARGVVDRFGQTRVLIRITKVAPGASGMERIRLHTKVWLHGNQVMPVPNTSDDSMDRISRDIAEILNKDADR